MTSTAPAKKPQDTRISTRVPENVHSILSEAAALVGATVNQFVVQSALERANAVIEQERSIILTSQAARKFIAALDNPPRANEKLKAAFRAHKEQF